MLLIIFHQPYKVQCTVHRVQCWNAQWHCLSASHVLNPMPVWSSKIEARTELFWRLKPKVRYLCVPQIQCWIDGGFHASPLHSHQCWVSQCKALCCTVCTACCTGQETKSSTVGVQESQHPFQQSRWRWWPGGKVKSAAKVKLPEGRHFGTNCSESQYCKERLLIQF